MQHDQLIEGSFRYPEAQCRIPHQLGGIHDYRRWAEFRGGSEPAGGSITYVRSRFPS